MKLEELKKLKKNKIAILGFGREGKSTLSFLLKLGFNNIFILDNNKNIEQINGINYILGDNYINNLGDFELIFKSSGISPYKENINKYKNILITQTQIFFDNYKGKVIGITGTKGKSTISTLTYKILKNIGFNVKLVGNIGNPVLDEIDILNNEKYDYIVYELSSYMLEGIKPKLYIGFLNNIYDCHLDWHNGKKNYKNAKINITINAKNNLINYDLKKIFLDKNDVIYFGKGGKYIYKKGLFYNNEQLIFKNIKTAIKGEHNKLNIIGVLGIIDIINKNNIKKHKNIIINAIENFSGLPHRMENIGTYNLITFIDDGIAVTPEATIAAIKTFKQNIGTIFLGGKDGKYNYTKLINILKKNNILNIVLFPETGEKIFGDLSNYKYEEIFFLDGIYNPRILKTKSMKSAVKFAYNYTPKGKICLLSNAAPSYNLWSGFEEKGLEFQNEVKIQSQK